MTSFLSRLFHRTIRRARPPGHEPRACPPGALGYRSPAKLATAHTIVVTLAALGSSGCITHACTERGCSSQFSAKIRTPTGAWPSGAYELTLRTNDQLEGTCTFRLPEQLPAPPGKVTGELCGTNLRFDMLSESECESSCDSNACSQRCTPIPGKFYGRLVVNNTPKRVELSLLRDGTPLLTENVEPSYQEFFPNGPDCGGACRQASLEYVLE